MNADDNRDAAIRPWGVENGLQAEVRLDNLRLLLMGWLATYGAATPGVTVLDNATVLLPPNNKLETDGLAIEPRYGGRMSLDGGELTGPPELVIEVVGDGSHDVPSKLRLYQQAGVQECVVALVEKRVVLWFTAENGHLVPLKAGGDGICRSRTFPGLWLDTSAIWTADGARFSEAIERGLASRERRQFVRKLRSEPLQFSISTLLFVVAVLAVPLAMIPSFRPRNLGRFPLGNGRSVAIYAQGALERPGGIFCDVQANGGIVVAGECFMDVAPKRAPESKFTVFMTHADDLLAIVLNDDIQFLYDFTTEESWSSCHADVDYLTRNFRNVVFAQKALERLDAESRGFHCSKLEALIELQTRVKTAGSKPVVATPRSRSAAPTTP